MKTHKITAAAIIAAALCSAAFAQPVAPSAAPAAAPNEVVYVQQLPNASDLTKAAAAQGVTVTQIDQTSSQVSVTYKYSNGAVNTVSYQPLANAETSGVPMPSSPAPAVTSGNTVVYTTATAPAYYYDYPYYGYGYYPYGWYPPVSIGLGFGFHGGFRGGFGGFHGGGRFR
jgi:hypothetical protein